MIKKDLMLEKDKRIKELEVKLGGPDNLRVKFCKFRAQYPHDSYLESARKAGYKTPKNSGPNNMKNEYILELIELYQTEVDDLHEMVIDDAMKTLHTVMNLNEGSVEDNELLKLKVAVAKHVTSDKETLREHIKKRSGGSKVNKNDRDLYVEFYELEEENFEDKVELLMSKINQSELTKKVTIMKDIESDYSFEYIDDIEF